METPPVRWSPIFSRDGAPLATMERTSGGHEFPTLEGARILGGMRAVLHDAEGPRRNRLAPLAIFPFALLVAFASPSTLVGMSAVLLALMLPGVLLRMGPREVEIVPGGGALHVRAAGLRNQTVHAKDVTGASTARLESGFALTLARRDRAAPTTLVFSTEEDLTRAREALGIGHGGLGDVAWPLVPSGAHTWARTSRAVAALLSLFALVLGVAGIFGQYELPPFGWFLLVWSFVPAILGMLGMAFRDASQWIRLGERGVTLSGRQRQQIPYSAVQGLRLRAGLFELGAGGYTLRTEHRVGAFAGPGVDATELGILGAHLAACVARANGQGPEKEETRTRVDTLRRGSEGARDWLARVDLAANMMTQTGYRGGTIEKEDLWILLRDPDAAEDLRAAAGRMLVRVEAAEEVRTRVGDILAAVREEDAQRRLRVAIFPELDPSGAELEQLEEEARKKRMVTR